MSDGSTRAKHEDSSYLNQWVRISELLSTYGDLLPERMHKMLQAYYSDDMSLSEIAEQAHVSRQAVHDSLKRGEEHLERYENNLKVVALHMRLHQTIDQLNDELGKLPSISSDPSVQQVRESVMGCLAEFETILSEGSH